MHAHHEVATPIPCKLDQRVPKNQINTRVSKNTQQAQFRTGKKQLQVHEYWKSKINGTTVKQ